MIGLFLSKLLLWFCPLPPPILISEAYPQCSKAVLVKCKQCERGVEAGLFYMTVGRGGSWLEGCVPLYLWSH